ncbi:hypothetical protein [Streptomyces sp. NPDC048720]|uniref:hypothetical protein n=1 Tax=Streptomyces sp. NPDC048720 TaxID=3365588 RepID=UPI00371039C7
MSDPNVVSEAFNHHSLPVDLVNRWRLRWRLVEPNLANVVEFLGARSGQQISP